MIETERGLCSGAFQCGVCLCLLRMLTFCNSRRTARGWRAGHLDLKLEQQNHKQRLDEHAADICPGPVLGLAANALLCCAQSVDGRGTHLPSVLVGLVCLTYTRLMMTGWA